MKWVQGKSDWNDLLSGSYKSEENLWPKLDSYATKSGNLHTIPALGISAILSTVVSDKEAYSIHLFQQRLQIDHRVWSFTTIDVQQTCVMFLY